MIQKSLLLDKIIMVYDMRVEIFPRNNEWYINILFQQKRENGIKCQLRI